MTVEWLIHLLQQQNPHAQVYLWSERHDLRADVIKGGAPCVFPVDTVQTFPGQKGVYIVEHDEGNYF